MPKRANAVAERAVASRLVSEADLARRRAALRPDADDQLILDWFVERRLLTKWQAGQLKSSSDYRR